MVDENRLLWNAVFAADMVMKFHQEQRLRGTRVAMDLIPHCIEDAEWLATEIVKELNSYKLKEGK